MRKKLKIFTAALCSAAVSLNVAVPYLHAEISQDQIDYKGLSLADTGSPEAEEYFPDRTFRKYLREKIDEKAGTGNSDGYLSNKEIESVTEIVITSDDTDYKDIENFAGIEIFMNLERFVFENIDTNKQSIGSSKVSLEFRDADESHTTEPYSSANTKLKYVSCNHSLIDKIDLTECPELEYLNCSDNELADLDLSKNTKLEYLYCSNTKLTSLDTKENTELKVLDCSYKKDDGKTEDGYYNPGFGSALTTLKLEKNAKLEYLDCSGHEELKTLTLPSGTGENTYLQSNSLKYIDCHECGLSALDLQDGASLQYLNCAGNSISSLNISKNTKLEYLDCSGIVKKDGTTDSVNTPLTLGQDSALRTLNCSNNKGIDKLDLIGYSTSLETLNCTGTELTSLDLSKNTALETLICEEQYKDETATPISMVSSDPSKITDLKLNRLLYKKAGLSFNEIFGNIIKSNDIKIDYAEGDDKSTNVDIYYTGNKLDVMNVVAKDVTKEAKFKETSASGEERTVTYTNLNGEAADLKKPDKEGDYTLANCTHLYKEGDRISVINGEPVIIYANGASKKITPADGSASYKKNSKVLNLYTDIAASYKWDSERKKASTGKVIVGITETPIIPAVSGNKISEASALATAKIKNGKITITAKKKEDAGVGQVCYLWVVDTGSLASDGNIGSNTIYECCPVNILVAPKKLEVRNEEDKADDPRLKDATRMIGEELEICIAGYADKSKTFRTNDATYSWSVPESVKDCVEIKPVEGVPDHFTIKAKAVKDNKDTKVNITFTCDQNNVKIKFVLKVSAASLGTPAPSAPTTPTAP